ncbi:hypothetical protein [Tanticharoenia sakaeratensis]|uniref:Glycosyltransferase RgtA/B/C/D-like domain-containing protein n=1 Tax=Tanticharoenia sakaeratensis NBRC 103193 TaxID=1231623 RepID=A0A0D6MGF8_9PROT|nr:hypothetical protein [Tanticharoenia sakaeratensis]GAN52724.1 hypothetical protein Tasa_002_004 [Tanticharoenia sakaeratensis NBRC 103193]
MTTISSRFSARLTETIETTLVGLVLFYAALKFHHVHVGAGFPPHATPGAGIFGWTDQQRYLRAALAWAHGDLRLSEHWYLPGYVLLAAPFIYVTPSDPFLIPDLVSLLLTGWFTARLAVRLFPDLPYASLLGALAFTVTSVRSSDALLSWVEPWTSTPLAPLLLALMLATLRLGDRVTPGRAALCGALWGLVVMVRPTEALTAGLPAVLVCAAITLSAPVSVSARARVATAGIGAALAVLAIVVVIHLAIFGFAPSEYMRQSFGTGFEWRALGIKWVVLVLGTDTFHSAAGTGLAWRFWWILPGFAGILASLLATRAALRHLLVGGAVMLHWAMYLCYRDLHVEGVWRYHNYHYFKWTFPILGLYAVALVWMACRRHTDRHAFGAMAVVALSACWHLEVSTLPLAEQTAHVIAPHRIDVLSGLRHPDRALLIATDAPPAASDDFMPIFMGPHHLEQGGRVWAYNGDFKAWPVPGGMAIASLRPLPRGTAHLTLAPEAAIAPDRCLVLVRMRVVFGPQAREQPLSSLCHATP